MSVTMSMEARRHSMMRMSTKNVAMSVASAGQLPEKIIEPEKNQCSPRDPWEPISNSLMHFNSKPGDQHAKERSEKNMAGPRQRGHRDCFVLAPTLGPGGNDKGKPVRRNRRVKKGDSKSR